MTAHTSRRFYLPTVVLLVGTLAVATAQPGPPTLLPTKISFKKPDATLAEVTAAISKVSKVPISFDPDVAKQSCPAAFEEVPFWEALEQVALQTGTKIVLSEKGSKVALEPRGMSKEVSCVSGPFRIVAKQVVGRALLDLGVTFHEVTLEVHWEPRIPVFRIDLQPTIARATDDRGMALPASPNAARGHPTEAMTDMKVKLTGLTRESKRIGVLTGEFRVTAAEKMLTFKFDGLTGKLPVTKTQDRVSATLKSIAKPDKTWDVELDLLYPEGHPIFESFEEQKWLRDNRLQLVSPGGKPVEPVSEEPTASGRRVTATYRFDGALNPLAKGWSLVCEAPGPLMELKIPFELRNIPIP